LIAQDKNKYNSPKYRLVARFSNTDITVQITKATIKGDIVMTAAYGHELVRFGAKAGFKSYAGAYATGLLAARRILKKIRLDGDYVGQVKPDGTAFITEQHGEKKPFFVLLDTGLKRTTKGSRVFGVLKGALDGGLEIPHKNKRFPGYNATADTFDPTVLRKHIFDGHVANYMKLLEQSNPPKYARQFSKYIKAGVKADGVESMWAKVHSAIREYPDQMSSKKPLKEGFKQKRYNKAKKNLAQRKNRIKQRLAAAKKVTVQ